MLPTAKTTKEMLPTKYGTKKPQSYTKDSIKEIAKFVIAACQMMNTEGLVNWLK